MESRPPEKRQPLSVMSTLAYSLGPAFSYSCAFQLAYTILQFASPQIVNLLIDFVGSDEPVWRGYFYTALIVAVTFIGTLLNAQTYYQQYLVGLRVRTALTSAVYKKSVKLSNVGRKEMTIGETTNLMSIDSQKFMELSLYANLIWTCPLQIALSMYFLWDILGPSCLAGFAVMALMIPLNTVVGKKLKKYQFEQMHCKDKRTKLMDEILNGMKVLKLYAWEASFEKQVVGIRDREIDALRKAAVLQSFVSFLWTCAPVLVSIACFATYVLSDDANVLDANTAFVSITLFNMLRIPFNQIPMTLIYFVQAQVSLDRLNRFLNSDELDPETVTHSEDSTFAIDADNATFSWEKGGDPLLRNIEMKVRPRELIAVVGAVGTGKSSLLSALLGEMELLGGTVNTKGRVAYVPQQAWMQNATLQNNVTFGKRFKRDLYDKVLDACALPTDLAMLPGGDQTEIGEKGINLSGGQKQRVSMARSVYANASLYLLDDPLSAVDSHVGKHIFENVIGPKGLLKRKTRILVTHGVGYLPQVDRILVMKGGRVSEEGSFRELLERDGEFSKFLVQYLAEANDQENAADVESTDLEEIKQQVERTIGREDFQRRISVARSTRSAVSDFASTVASSMFGGNQVTVKDKREMEKLHKAQNKERGETYVQQSMNAEVSTLTVGKSSPEHNALAAAAAAAGAAAAGAQLIAEETAETGGVKWRIYKYFFRAMGWGFLAGTIFFYSVYQAFQVAANIWLSVWTSDPRAEYDESVQNMYLGIYGLFGALSAGGVMLATAAVMIGTILASAKLHKTLLSRIVRAPMSFFDTTPIGRILNRFAKEVDIMDVTIPMNFRMLLSFTFQVIGTLIAIIFALPIFIVVIIPIAFVFYFIQKFYVATARQVKRLESITRSPIYSHFGETLSGAATIRAYKMLPVYIAENEKKIDLNQTCYYPTFVSSRWLSVRLETIANLIIFFTSLLAVVSRGRLDPGVAGLALSYALNVTSALNMLVRTMSEVETNMVSVERISEYQQVAQEAPFEIPEQDPPPEWPQYGAVTFENYQTRYREGLDLVLRGIDCNIRRGEKIGIVGRTGAGKSSLTLALFRIIESAGGSIYIDGENIGLLGLGKLRSRITIIPQDPVLFSGSMRMNLDPFSTYSDRDIWRALDHAHLRAYVSNLPGGLHYTVNEGGENLSVGQRQLVCLARALLRKTKLLVLDEATAAVDMETDDLIQATIRKEFSDCTVLTIAHRLNTIMDSSKVMVLDAGKIKEFDSPERLMGDRRSIFYGMAKDAGLAD